MSARWGRGAAHLCPARRRLGPHLGLIGALCALPTLAQAEGGGGDGGRIVLWVALASLLPLLAMVVTAFAKASVLLAALRAGLGADAPLPALLLPALALVLSLVITAPIGARSLEAAAPLPSSAEGIDAWQRAAQRAWPVWADFLERNTAPERRAQLRQWMQRGTADEAAATAPGVPTATQPSFGDSPAATPQPPGDPHATTPQPIGDLAATPQPADDPHATAPQPPGDLAATPQPADDPHATAPQSPGDLAATPQLTGDPTATTPQPLGDPHATTPTPVGDLAAAPQPANNPAAAPQPTGGDPHATTGDLHATAPQLPGDPATAPQSPGDPHTTAPPPGDARAAGKDLEAHSALILAFVLSELSAAFSLAVLLLLPFLLIDLLVANTLAAVGFTGLSTQAVALPFKLLLFIGVDGWALLTQRFIASYTL